MRYQLNKPLDHQHSKGQEMQSGQCLRQSFIVARQTSEARRPPEGALDHPPTRQQHKALLCFREFDDFQPDAVRVGCLSGSLACIALINEGHFDRFADDLLNLFSQFADLCAVLLVGGRDEQSQQVAQRVNGNVGFAALAPFRPIVLRPTTRFRRD